jgi:hypothetical protein
MQIISEGTRAIATHTCNILCATRATFATRATLLLGRVLNSDRLCNKSAKNVNGKKVLIYTPLKDWRMSGLKNLYMLARLML